MTSLDASKAAVYSASHDEVATVFCFRAFQEINPEPKVNPYPPTLLLVSRQLAQCESVNLMSDIDFPPRRNFKSLDPFKYRMTHIAAFQWWEYE